MVQILPPRKRRTRQHVIADLSVHHVMGFILEEGHTAQQLSSDYGYDLIMWTFDPNGYMDPGEVYFQVKASEALERSESEFVFDADIRDLNQWMMERMPVVFVLFDATSNRAYWLHVQDYLRRSGGRTPRQEAKTLRIRVPKKQRFRRRAVSRIRELSLEAQRPILGTSS